MVRLAKLVTVCVALVCLSKLQQTTFVTPPRRSTLPVAAIAAATLGSGPAYADEIGDAAKKLAKAAYPLLKDIDWNSGAVTRLALTKPGAGSAEEWTKAVGKAINMGASMNIDLLKKGVDAHHLAIGTAASDPRGVTSQSDFEDILAALGRMIASVPESQTMEVYDSFSKLVSPDVPKYLMSTVKKADAEAAYKGLMEFKDVVKANPLSAAASSPTGSVSAAGSARIEAAAQKLSANAYPFLKDVDWSTELPLKPAGYSSNSQQVLKAIDKALIMGSNMDGSALKAAALAHVKAIDDMDAKGVTTQEDFKSIVTELGKAIASVPEKQVMDVYNSFSDVVRDGVPKYLMSTVPSADAVIAYKSLMSFKDVVKAAR